MHLNLPADNKCLYPDEEVSEKTYVYTELEKEVAPIYYNVLDRSIYKMTVQLCKDIEDLATSFITYEDLMIVQSSFIHYVISKTNQEPQIVYFHKAIKVTINDWYSTIKPGKASTSIIPPDVEILMDEVPGLVLHRLCKHPCKISGNRIVNMDKLNALYTKRKTPVRSEKVLLRDIKSLIKLCQASVNKKYKLDITFVLASSKLMYHIIFTKRVCSWRDITHMFKIVAGSYILPYTLKQDLPWIKKVWDDPTLTLPFIK